MSIYRTLSEHHWNVAEVHMAKSRNKHLWVGRAFKWTYLLSRDTTDSRIARREHIHNGKLIYTQITTLPIPHRCHKYIGKRPRRCKNKTFGEYCHSHV